MNVLIITDAEKCCPDVEHELEQRGHSVFTQRLDAFPFQVLQEHDIPLLILILERNTTKAPEFCKKVHSLPEYHRQILIIACQEARDTVVECLAAGAQSCFFRPYTSETLQVYLTFSIQLVEKKACFKIDHKNLGQGLPLSAVLFDYTNDLIQIIDQHGRFCYVNSVWMQALGYSESDLDTMSFFDIVTHEQPDFQFSIETWLNNSQTQGASEFELIASDGRFVSVKGKIHLLPHSVPSASYFCSFTNITEQKRLTESLQFSEERYRLVYETAQIGISMVDESEYFLLVNPALAQMLGYSQEELLQMNLSQITEQSEFNRYQKETQFRKLGLKNEYETKLRRKNGEVRLISISVSPVYNSRGEYLGALGISTDITEIRQNYAELEKFRQKLLELVEERTAELKKVNETLLFEIAERKKTEVELLRFKKAVETMQLGVTISDLDRTIIYSNPAEAAMHGYTVAELIGNNIGIFAPSRYHAPMPRTKIEKIKSFTRETENIRKDGTVFPARLMSDVVKDAEGTPIAIVSCCQDITIEKKALDDLKESEEKFRRLTETAPLAIFILKHRKFVYVNPAAIEMIGYSADELMAMSLSAFHISDEDVKTITVSFSKAYKTQTTTRHEILITSRTGHQIWVYLSFTTIDYQGGPAILGTATDITEQKHVENELRLFNERLEQKVAERTQELNQALEKEKELHELKSQFVSLVSHEFRTPLTSISSSAEIIQRYGHKLTAEKKEQYLERIKTNVHEMAYLLDDVTLIGKTDSGRVQLSLSQIEIDSFFHDLIEEIQLSSKNKCQISYTNTCPQPILSLDERLLHHIVVNLLTNSIKFSRQGSHITLSTGIENGRFQISVKDEGCGIPEEDQSIIFEAFCRAHNVLDIDGTGLGLTIVKRCVDLFHGSISFTSQVDRGTTFIINLPLELKD
ncbi:PAS domain S-box protein [bacterium]|nr:PAS domain S-box protein [bacterium]